VPIPDDMIKDLQSYWKMHKNPLLLFPNAGRGETSSDATCARMAVSTHPIPHSSLQRIVCEVRKELNIPELTIHTLRHSFATHMMEAGASIHTVKAILGHKQINSTMVYLHLTHRSEQDSLALVKKISKNLPS